MPTSFTRRGLLAASAALSACLVMPARVRAASGASALTATTRTIEVVGRAATVWGLTGASGAPGLSLEPGQRFRVDLTNELDTETLVHWHGQIPPNGQDGVPDLPLPKLRPGETRAYNFDARPGTHWMHAHVPEHELLLLAAPLIVRSAEDTAADRQEAVLFLHDFSFKPPGEVLAEIAGGTAMAGMDHEATGTGGGMGTMGAMNGMMPGMDMQAMMGGGGMSGLDLNDYNFDAYLVNDRTLDDPQVIQVEKSGRVLLRVINAAAATVFWIDTGALPGHLVAVDGEPVQPLAGRRFGLAMGQRLDLEVAIPADGGAFPILALREGARERTGLILATAGARVAAVAGLSDDVHPPFSANLSQELALRAATPLPVRAAARAEALVLGGSMMPYVWTIDGQTWGNHVPVAVSTGERIELSFHNMSTMAHPMHLHGHKFQVVAIGLERFPGAVRDTVHVPPMSMVTVAVDAGEAARWMLHCHHMPHLATGMMTEFAVSA